MQQERTGIRSFSWSRSISSCVSLWKPCPSAVCSQSSSLQKEFRTFSLTFPLDNLGKKGVKRVKNRKRVFWFNLTNAGLKEEQLPNQNSKEVLST